MTNRFSHKTRQFVASAMSGLMLFAPLAQAEAVTYVYQKHLPGLPSEVPSGSVAPGLVDFGEVQIPDVSPWAALTFANTGPEDLSIGDLTAPAGFEVQNGCGAVLSVGQSCPLQVRFAPTVGGTASGNLVVNSSAHTAPDLVALTGVGTLPVALFSANPLSFGAIEVGEAAPHANLGISNIGTGVLTLSDLTFGGSNYGFAVTEGSCAPLPKSLGSQESCALGVDLTPTSVGALSGLVNVVTNDATGAYQIPLQATGIQSQISVAPGALAFGDTLVGAEAAAKSLTVTNGGTAPLRIATVTIVGENADQFPSTSNTCGNPVAPGNTCTISAAALPTSVGAKSANIEIVSNAPTSATLAALTVTGVQPELAFRNAGDTAAIAGLTYGNTNLGTSSAPQSFKIKNTGTYPMAVSSVTLTGTHAAEFSRTHDCTTVAAGDSCTVSVTFTPTSVGGKTAAVAVADDAPGSPHSLALAATGDVGLPGAPTGLSASGGYGQVSLSWTAPTDTGGGAITGYKVFRGTTSNPTALVQTLSGSTLNWTSTGLAASTTYYFRVAATNSAGDGAYSTQASATTSTPANCTAPWGGTVAHGSGVYAYASSSVSCGGSCSSQYRTCDNGTLSGSYTNSSCSVQSCTASCSLPWGGTLAHGGSVTAYLASSVCGTSCTSQTRTCSNGSLSGSYTNQSCTVKTTGTWTQVGSDIAAGCVMTQSNTSAPSGSCACGSGAVQNLYTTPGTACAGYTHRLYWQYFYQCR
jgi:hypothetical protein